MYKHHANYQSAIVKFLVYIFEQSEYRYLRKMVVYFGITPKTVLVTMNEKIKYKTVSLK